MFSNIIIGVDGSENSLRALKYAQNLAEKFQSRLIMVHAYPRTSDLHDFEGYDILVARRKNDGRKIMAKARELLAGSEFEIVEDLLEEPAEEAILSVAEAQDADAAQQRAQAADDGGYPGHGA